MKTHCSTCACEINKASALLIMPAKDVFDQYDTELTHTQMPLCPRCEAWFVQTASCIYNAAGIDTTAYGGALFITAPSSEGFVSLVHTTPEEAKALLRHLTSEFGHRD